MANDIAEYLKGFDLKKAKTVIIIAIVIVVIYVMVEFGGDFNAAISSVLTSLGLKKTAAETAAEAAIAGAGSSASSANSPWSPDLYNNNPDASTLDYSTLQTMSDSIYNSQSSIIMLRLSTNGSQGLAAIKQCNNKIDVSNLVVVFQQEYNQDLYSFLQSNYTSSANEIILQQIITFVQNLPAQ